MKKLLSLILLFCSLGAGAQQGYDLVTPSVTPKEDAKFFKAMQSRMDNVRKTCNRPTVALVLSGGGAKGAAEVGVIRRLEELDIPVDMVLGTSIGGLVGGLYSLGYDSHFMDSLMRNADWSVLLSDDVDPKFVPLETKMRRTRYNLTVPFNYGKATEKRKVQFSSSRSESEVSESQGSAFAKSLPSGLVGGFNVDNLFSRLTVGYHDSTSFMNLPVPYVCVSSDLVSGRAKNWTSGRLPLAMRSTMSIPGLFTPVRTQGMVLTDGGMRNNFPVDLARAMGADIVIGVVLSTGFMGYDETYNIGNLVSQMIDMLSRDAYEKNMARADIYISPDLKGYDMLSFVPEAIDTMISRGYAAALATDNMLRPLSALTAGKHSPRTHAPAKDISATPVRISGISFPGLSAADSAYLRDQIRIREGQELTATQIEESGSRIFGSGTFRMVNYSLHPARDGGYNLSYHCEDGPAHRMGLGVRMDTEDMVSMLIGLGINSYNLSGHKLDFEARIGQTWYGQLHYSFSSGVLPSLNLRIRSGYDSSHLMQDGANYNAGHWHHTADAFVSGLHSSLLDFRAGARYDYHIMDKWLTDDGTAISKESMKSDYRSSFFTIYGNASAYTMDDYYYPTRGFSLNVGYRFVPGGDQKRAHVFEGSYRHHVRLGGRISLIPSLDARFVIRSEENRNSLISNLVGGAVPGRYQDSQMTFAGFHRATFLPDHAINLQLDLRARIIENTFLSLKGGALKASPNFAGIFSEPDTLLFGGALELGYDSIIGPIKAQLQYSNITKLGFYLSIGFDF